MAVRKFQVAIETLQAMHPRFFLEPHAVACVAVTSRYASTPATFAVDCAGIRSRQLGKQSSFELVVSWQPETIAKAERLRATVQNATLVEMAAVALGLILVHAVVPLYPLDVTACGDRVDYRSLRRPAVVEMSGTERFGEFERRYRQKV